MKNYLLILINLFCLSAFSQIVRDGDSFNYNGSEIRLYNIDALESSQPHSEICKKILLKLIKNKTLKYKVLKYDNYNRAICIVYADNKNVSLEMIKNGGAIVYRKYCSETAFYSAEKQAKKLKLGIWKYNFISPEKYRKL